MPAPRYYSSDAAAPASTGAAWSPRSGAGHDGDARPLRRGGYRGFLPADLADQLRSSVASGDGVAALSAPVAAPCACGCGSRSGFAVVLLVLAGFVLLRRTS